MNLYIYFFKRIKYNIFSILISFSLYEFHCIQQQKKERNKLIENQCETYIYITRTLCINVIYLNKLFRPFTLHYYLFLNKFLFIIFDIEMDKNIEKTKNQIESN